MIYHYMFRCLCDVFLARIPIISVWLNVIDTNNRNKCSFFPFLHKRITIMAPRSHFLKTRNELHLPRLAYNYRFVYKHNTTKNINNLEWCDHCKICFSCNIIVHNLNNALTHKQLSSRFYLFKFLLGIASINEWK